jgi:hypothetical protein
LSPKELNAWGTSGTVTVTVTGNLLNTKALTLVSTGNLSSPLDFDYWSKAFETKQSTQLVTVTDSAAHASYKIEANT